MNLAIIFFVVYCTVVYGNFEPPSQQKVEKYVDAINDFIEGTKNFTYPTDSREYLQGKNESIINECSYDGEYDFIIVGAGSTGTVLANRLTEISKWKVLIIEAGEKENIAADVPNLVDYLRLSKYNWGYKSVPQKNSCLSYVNRSEVVARGKALGGSSVINLMMYVRGNHNDYNKWASEGNPGWSYDEVLNYFKKSEDCHIQDPDPGYHGFNGTLYTETMNVLSPLTFAYLLANKELGRDLIEDFNGQYQEGFSRLQTTTYHGMRDSGYRAFLEPVQNRPNLRILSNTLAVKILIENDTAYGIQYVNNGTSYCANASKEVIISGGAINSPQLLMISGIGPKQQLEEHNIEVIKDLPGVGQNMWDHIFHFLQYFTTNYTSPDINETEAVTEYLEGRGYLTSADYNQDVGFVNLYSPDKTRPDVEHIFRASKMPNMSYEYYKQTKDFSEDIYNYIFKPLTGRQTWCSYTVLLHPKSKGTVTLKTNSPFDFPLIDPNYFDDPQDLNTLIAAYKDVIRMSKTKAMQKYDSQLFKIDLPACRCYQEGSDEQIGCLIQNLASSISHFAGTCRMGPKNDSMAVVDTNLNVYGVNNLRVADASVIPVSISGHTNAPAFMVGEKTADIIKEFYI